MLPVGQSNHKEVKKPKTKVKVAVIKPIISEPLNLFESGIAIKAGNMIKLEIISAPAARIPTIINQAVNVARIRFNCEVFKPATFE